MRWDAQRLDVEDPSTLPGMPGIRGLLRSVEVPEFPGLTFHEVRAKSALNRVPGESAMPFPWTINPYRGCSHACVYCEGGGQISPAGPTRWLELDAAPTSTPRWWSRPTSSTCCAVSWPGPRGGTSTFALGTNADPYQRAEGRYKLMPGVIRALADSGTPFSILTKGTLLRRDIPLLVEAASGFPSGSGSAWPSGTTRCTPRWSRASRARGHGSNWSGR